MRAVSQGLSFRMKDLQLTWLHSCLLGQRWHDYRAEVVPPTFSSMDQHAFQGMFNRMSRRWEGWLQLLLLLLFCWCCCFPQGRCCCFNRCYRWTCANPYRPPQLHNTKLCFRELQLYEFKLQMLHLPQMLPEPVSCLALQHLFSNLWQCSCAQSLLSSNSVQARLFPATCSCFGFVCCWVKRSDWFDKSRPNSIAQVCCFTFVLLVKRKMEPDIYSLREYH